MLTSLKIVELGPRKFRIVVRVTVGIDGTVTIHVLNLHGGSAVDTWDDEELRQKILWYSVNSILPFNAVKYLQDHPDEVVWVFYCQNKTVDVFRGLDRIGGEKDSPVVLDRDLLALQ